MPQEKSCKQACPDGMLACWNPNLAGFPKQEHARVNAASA